MTSNTLSPATLTLFAAILIAFCVQSVLTEYVQTTLQFRHPFLLFYIAHSSFAVVLPLHLAWLHLTSPTPLIDHIDALRDALTAKFSLDPTSPKLPVKRLLFAIVAVTIGVTVPALLWYASVSLTSISDITALWNANAIYVYAFAVPILGTAWSSRAAAAVMCAFAGTLAVVYGASESDNDTSQPADINSEGALSLLGTTLSFIAGVGYALYQVVYKRYIALDPPVSTAPSTAHYTTIASTDALHEFEAGSRRLSEHDMIGADLPFGLWSNFWVTSIGICTFWILGFAIPFVDPPAPVDSHTALSIAGIACTGLVFNACYLVLLGMWGPVLASVGNLLTIVIMLIYDVLMNGLAGVTIWSLGGCAAIIAGFVVLVTDVLRSKNSPAVH